MKHNLKITAILLLMFIITQFMGLLVLYADPLKVDAISSDGTIQQISNPYLTWLSPVEAKTQADFTSFFVQIVLAFILAVGILFFLMKFKLESFLRGWFFLVVAIALFITFLAFEKIIPFMIEIKVALILAAVFALIFSYLKIYKRRLFIHNFTEILIYPGISAVFVPLLNIYTVLSLLVIISVYDAWAVWKSGIMQKMAKYQMNKLNIFSGFFIPYVSKKIRARIKEMKKSKSKKKIKVNVAILGGGDVIFPIITSGVIMKSFGIIPALFVILGAVLGLSYLFFFAEKKKFYPAMPFITAGILIGLGLFWIIGLF
ncbi:MAG: presenilin family intramembrane aspartyl protease [archaeon]